MAERTEDNELYDNHGEIDLAGSSNAYTATTARAITGYYKGLRICGKANHTNTGASTLNVNGLGAVAIRKQASTALVAGDIVSGQYYDFAYDATNGWFQLLNPSTVSAVGGFPMTASGDRWGVIAPVGTDGVMEVGRYIDFHNSDADTGDNAVRLETNGGTTGLFETPSGGSLKRLVSLINSTLAQGDVIYYDGTNFVRLAPGTSGQFLKTNGAAANPAWATVTTGPTVVAAQATTSGTQFDFTGLPADVSRITVNFSGVSLSGTDHLLVQIGDAGGVENTGYTSTTGANSGVEATSTAGFILGAGAAATLQSGTMVLSKLSTTDWVASHSAAREGTDVVSGAGRKSLSAGPLDRVRIAATGANTFDAGSVNIIYD
jgi:hypothetical protein